jgi:hypothetical protein
MASKNSIVIGVTKYATPDGAGVRLGILLRLTTKPDILDGERARCLRDVRRAIQTFELVADIEDPALFEDLNNGSMGPFMLAESREYASMVHAALRPEAIEEQALGRLKQGVHAAAAIFRAAGDYRISLKVKPAIQLDLPSTNGASAAPLSDGSAEQRGDGETSGESAAAPATDPEPPAPQGGASGGNGSSTPERRVAKKRGAAAKAPSTEDAQASGPEEADDLPV